MIVTSEKEIEFEKLLIATACRLEIQLADVENYTEHAGLAAELGQAELKVRLEEMAADEARHARELRRLLRGL